MPEEILTDNGKVFTGRFNQPPVEVLFDRICRENGITHRLTQPRSPTTTGKIERFHRSLRTEFRTDRVFASLRRRRPSWTRGSRTTTIAARTRRSGWHTPGRTVPPWRAGIGDTAAGTDRRRRPDPARGDGTWVARRASKVGVVCVNWQQVCLGVAAAGRNIDVWVTDEVLQFFDGDQLLRTETANQHRGGPQETSIRTRRTSHNLNNECHGSTEAQIRHPSTESLHRLQRCVLLRLMPLSGASADW